MKRIIILLILILSLTACSKKEENKIVYNLNIDKYYGEKIIAYLPEDAYEIAKKDDSDIPPLEYILLYEDQYPIHSNIKTKYNKDIIKDEGIIVELSYNYTEEDFFNSTYIQNCFENYNIESTSDEVNIELSGMFYCYHDKEIEINIITKYPVESFNGSKKKNTYTWTIDESNKDNVSINIKYNRFLTSMITNYDDIKEKDNKTLIIIIDIVVIIVSIIVILLIKRRDKK